MPVREVHEMRKIRIRERKIATHGNGGLDSLVMSVHGWSAGQRHLG